KEELLNAKKEMIQGFYEGWMKGVAEMKVPKIKTRQHVTWLNSMALPNDAKGMMANVYWTNH
ncbi:MAG: hypothetical protein IPO65_18735, partial [Saprospiraceae bacterium]|nr:hypothetical protein [Saprospiraceae bacterium]